MAGVNKVILLGYLGSDPDVRYTSGGKMVTKFSIATNEKWKAEDGTPQQRTEWHKVTTFGRLAEICRDYLAKGKQVYLEGKIQTNTWDKKGETRYFTEIIAHQVQFLSDGDGSEKRASNEPPPTSEDDVPF